MFWTFLLDIVSPTLSKLSSFMDLLIIEFELWRSERLLDSPEST